MSKHNGANSEYDTKPSSSTSTSLNSRLISFRVSPSSAECRHFENSFLSRVPFPSASASEKIRSIISSSSSLGIPCRRWYCTCSLASSSSSSFISRATSFALMLLTISVMIGTNSVYSKTPSSFSSASERRRRASFFERPISVPVKRALNSFRSKYPLPSVSYFMN